MVEHFRKKANARIKHAQAVGVDVVLTAAMDKLVGGTWVGGNIVLTDDYLGFTANAFNKLIQRGELDATFDVADIEGARIAGGFGTKIIAVQMEDGTEFEFRCTKANDVLSTLRSVIASR